MRFASLVRAGALFAATCLSITPALADDPSRASGNASQILSRATGSLVLGSLSLVAAASAVTIDAVEQVGDGVVLILKGVSTGTTASVRVAASALGGASVAVGTSVKVVGEASGHAIYALGRLIAFVPNEVGQSLIHHSRIDAGKAR